MAAFTNTSSAFMFSDFFASRSQYLRTFTTLCIYLIIVLSLVNGQVKRPRGVSLTNEPFYSNPDNFFCLDGSAGIVKSKVNDDYCDCKDGSDEPGTSACPNGRFHCGNKGYIPKYVPSSRVNDGICDCCDASDEYKGAGASKCFNNCRELSRVELERKREELETMNKGYIIRQEYIKAGKEKQAEREETLRKLKGERDEAMQVKADKEAVKNAAEEPERIAKEAHKAMWEAQLAINKEREDLERANKAFAEIDIDQDDFVSFFEIQTHTELDSDEDNQVTVEEAQTILGGVDRVNLATFLAQIWPAIKDKIKLTPVEGLPTENQPTDVPPVEGAYPPGGNTNIPPADNDDATTFDEDDYDEDMQFGDDYDDEDDEDYDEDDEDRAYIRAQKIRNQRAKEEKEEEKDAAPPYSGETQLQIDAADKARAEFEEASNRLTDLEKSIEDLEKQMAVDLGPDQEFQAIQGQCFDMADREYTYKLCPFDKSAQEKQGAETSLGKWDNWDGPDDNKYSRMRYTKGRNCWNGPDRSTTVLLRCGLENKLLSASEPEKCTYQMEFETPALCLYKTDPNTDLHHHEEL